MRLEGAKQKGKELFLAMIKSSHSDTAAFNNQFSFFNFNGGNGL